jgi:hypothetical protein
LSECCCDPNLKDASLGESEEIFNSEAVRRALDSDVIAVPAEIYGGTFGAISDVDRSIPPVKV